MTENWKLQVSVKIPHDTDNYRDTLVNLRAETSAELDQLLAYVEQKGASIGSLVAAVRAGANVGTGIPGSQPAPPAPQQEQGWAPPPQQGPPQWAGQQQAPAAAPQGAPGPSCVHGPMTFRSGQGKKGPWTAHFCPTPKGTPGQCEPVWG